MLKADLEQLEQRARLSVVHEKRYRCLKKNRKIFDDSKYAIPKMSLALSCLEVAEKKLQEANAERKHSGVAGEGSKMHKAQEELNVKFKQLYSLFELGH